MRTRVDLSHKLFLCSFVHRYPIDKNTKYKSIKNKSDVSDKTKSSQKKRSQHCFLITVLFNCSQLQFLRIFRISFFSFSYCPCYYAMKINTPCFSYFIIINMAWRRKALALLVVWRRFSLPKSVAEAPFSPNTNTGEVLKRNTMWT